MNWFDRFIFAGNASPEMGEKKPSQTYRVGRSFNKYADLETGRLVACVSREHRFPLFLDLIRELDTEANCILFARRGGEAQDCRRPEIETAVLLSVLPEFESLLLGDGRVAFTVISKDFLISIELLDTKELEICAPDLTPFAVALEKLGARRSPIRKPIAKPSANEAQSEMWDDDFERLCWRIEATDDFDEAKR